MLAFVRIQKTAGTTVLRILRREFGVRHCDVEPWERGTLFDADDLARVMRIHPRLESIAGPDVRSYSNLERVRPGIRYFTFLRDPITRCASHFEHDVRVHGYARDLSRWIEARSARNWQTRFLAGKPDLGAAKAALSELALVGLVEEFEESLLLLAKLIDRPGFDVSYHRANVAPDPDARTLLLEDPRNRDVLADANDLDLALYQFARTELFPAQRRRLGPVDPDRVARLKEARTVKRGWPRYHANIAFRNLVYKPFLARDRRRATGPR